MVAAEDHQEYHFACSGVHNYLDPQATHAQHLEYPSHKSCQTKNAVVTYGVKKSYPPEAFSDLTSPVDVLWGPTFSTTSYNHLLGITQHKSVVGNWQLIELDESLVLRTAEKNCAVGLK